MYGANRRVEGLRREEVAILAGISVEYYTKLERGSVGSVSDSVLEGLAHALQLDEAERDHLYRLIRTASTSSSRTARRIPTRKQVRPTLQRILDQMPMPAYLRNGRFDVLAANDLGRALYSPLYEQAGAGGPPRTAPASCSSTPPPRRSSSTTTRQPTTAWRSSVPRPGATPTPRSSPTSSASSPPAATTSADVGQRTTCATTAPVASVSTTHSSATSSSTTKPSSYPGMPGQRINIYTAPPDSASAERLDLLASWTAPARIVSPAEDTSTP